MIPFTIDQFLQVFQQYNVFVWPAKIVLHLLALTAVVLTIRGGPQASRIISGILATFWLWMAIVYHLLFFTKINRAAYLFAAMFAAQAMIFIWQGVVRSHLSFNFNFDVHSVAGAILVAYALVGYPLLGTLFGHKYPAAPTFGVPCPTGIFTFGLLMTTAMRVPPHILLIPLIWAAIGFWAAVSLGMREDFGIFVGGVSSALMMLTPGGRRWSENRWRTG